MKKEEEERIREASKNYPVDSEPLASSGGTITGDHTPFVVIGLTPFTPSNQHIVDRLNTIGFYKTRNTITRRSQKRLKMGMQTDVVTMTENTIMEGTHKDPKFMASVNIAAVQANANNVDRFMEDVEHHKEKILELKDSRVKT